MVGGFKPKNWFVNLDPGLLGFQTANTKRVQMYFFVFQSGALFLAICYILEQKPVLC